MKILLAVDGSSCGDAAVEEVAHRSWPMGSEVKVLFVVHATFVPDPLFIGAAAYYETLEHERQESKIVLEKASTTLHKGRGSFGLEITTETAEGSPKEVILERAKEWGADLVVMGSHGRGAVKRAVLGSVSHAVVSHAPCPVEIVPLPAHLDERPAHP